LSNFSTGRTPIHGKGPEGRGRDPSRHLTVAFTDVIDVRADTMKRLLLISPVGQKSGYLLSRITTFPPLGLAYVAAATPSDWDVRILDENFETFAFEEADLVGITSFTSNIRRAYEIARVYRERNIKVVMGGIHVSMNPDEALRYADAVVVGEVEGIWKQVLDDFRQGRLAPKYIGPQIDLTHSVIARGAICCTRITFGRRCRPPAAVPSIVTSVRSPAIWGSITVSAVRRRSWTSCLSARGTTSFLSMTIWWDTPRKTSAGRWSCSRE